MMTDDKFARDLRILALHKAGVTLQDIGDQFGITRERVRQIVRNLGGVPKRETQRERDSRILAAIISENLTVGEAASRFRISGGVAYAIGHKAGHVFRRDTKAASYEIEQIVSLVREGVSIRQACGGDTYLANLVSEHCRSAGISLKHGRHRDFTRRERIIPAMRAAGCSWAEITEAVSAAEGRKVNFTAICAWAYNRGLAGERNPKRKPKAARIARMPIARPKLDACQEVVVPAQDAKTAALLNYGKCTASAVAKAHGVTRNSIIGHWFRLRKAGLLPMNEGQSA